jgi:hypothetical protein
VAEIPPVRTEVTEYRLHRLTCTACGTRACAPLPDGVPTGEFGPRLQVLLSVLAGTYRLSEATMRHDSLDESADRIVAAGFERAQKGVSGETDCRDDSE